MIATRCVQPIAVLFLLFGLPGCQTDTPTAASGSPEIMVKGVRAEAVKPMIIAAALNQGMTLKSHTPIEVTVERPWEITAAKGITAPLVDLDGTSRTERLTFSMADSGSGTRIVLDRYMVRTSRPGKEYVSPANDAPGLEKLQTILDAVAPSLGSTQQTIDLPVVNPPPRISAPLTKLTTETLARR